MALTPQNNRSHLALIAIIGCPVPRLEPELLLGKCLAWEKRLGSRLSPRQMARIQKFPLSGRTLYARASRALARLMALSLVPPDLVLDADRNGIPFFRDAPAGIGVGFSHAGSSAFCMLALKSRPEAKIALDAESSKNMAATPGIKNFLARINPGRKRQVQKLSASQILKLWTIYEACLKLGTPTKDFARGVLVNQGQRGKGIVMANGRQIHWRALPFMGHWLCAAATAPALENISLRWLSPARLIGE